MATDALQQGSSDKRRLEPSATPEPAAELAAAAYPDSAALEVRIAERIADVVADFLSHKAMQAGADSSQLVTDIAERLQSSTAEPCMVSSVAQTDGHTDASSEQAQPSTPLESAAPESSAQGTRVATSHGPACEQDFLAALLQGSPARPVSLQSVIREPLCEEDFLAALLLGSPGAPEQLRQAASPGLMHALDCSETGSSTAGRHPVASSRPKPWTVQWVGRLTQQEIETATQEVTAASLVQSNV